MPHHTAPRLTSHLEVRSERGDFLGDKRVRLLEAIEQHGSISQAARHVPLSYKAAWDAVDAMNNLADAPLVERSTGGRAGGGTRLTDHGRRLIALYRAMEAEHQAALDRLASAYASAPVGDIAAFQRLLRRMAVRASARNQFVGTVCALRTGPVDCEVHLRIDPPLELRATITRESLEQLALGLGSEVIAMVKAPSVQLSTSEPPPNALRNRLWGTVQRIVEGTTNAEVVLDLGLGRTAAAVISPDSLAALGVSTGTRACAVFDASSVILVVIDDPTQPF